MLRIDEVIVVEGKYDKIKLSSFLDATILETSGFGIFNNPALKRLLSEAAKKRGLIVLTDSDNAGFQIRRYLRSFIDDTLIRNVYVPIQFGKEKRKRTSSASGILGVEGLDEEVIISALKKAGVSADMKLREEPERLTAMDLYRLGLLGKKNSRKKRAVLMMILGFPPNMSKNEVLDALSLFMSKEGLIEFCKEHAAELSAMD